MFNPNTGLINLKMLITSLQLIHKITVKIAYAHALYEKNFSY